MSEPTNLVPIVVAARVGIVTRFPLVAEKAFLCLSIEVFQANAFMLRFRNDFLHEFGATPFQGI